MTDTSATATPETFPPATALPIEHSPWRRKLHWFAAEILVVVAGILIALALNAWWEDRQAHALETRSLRELRDALSNDLKDIRFNAGHHECAEASARRLREHMAARQPYSKALDVDFGNIIIGTYSVRDETAYDTLKQRGLDTIANTALRTGIGHLYGVSYPKILPFQQRTWDFLNTQVMPFYIARFRYIGFPGPATPVDYESLLDSTEFAAMLDLLAAIHGIHARTMRRTESEVTTLITQIDAELARR